MHLKEQWKYWFALLLDGLLWPGECIPKNGQASEVCVCKQQPETLIQIEQQTCRWLQHPKAMGQQQILPNETIKWTTFYNQLDFHHGISTDQNNKYYFKIIYSIITCRHFEILLVIYLTFP